jgi:YVTN family beta-propeller protein
MSAPSWRWLPLLVVILASVRAAAFSTYAADAAATPPVVTTIPLAHSPAGIVATANGQRVYVANGSDVSAIDPTTDTVVLTTPVGDGAENLKLSADGSRLYVENYSDGTISVIDTTSDAVMATVEVGTILSTIDVTPDGLHAFVACLTSDSEFRVCDISTASNTVVSRIPVPGQPIAIAINADGSRLYVASVTDADHGSISVIDTQSDSVVASVPRAVGNMAVSPVDGTVYACEPHRNRIDVIDAATDTVSTTVAFADVGDLMLAPDGSALYVVGDSTGKGLVGIIDTATDTVSKTIRFAGYAGFAGISPDGKRLYVSHPTPDVGLSAVNLATGNVVGTAGVSAVAAATAGDESLLFVTSPSSDAVNVLDTQMPFGLHVTSRDADTVTLAWSALNNTDGFQVRRSTNGGATWTPLPDGATSDPQLTVDAPSAGQAYEFDVTSSSDARTTEPILISGGGTAAQQFTVQSASGDPISGGAVSWAATDSHSHSSISYPLTAQGVVTFGEVAVGSATVTLDDG